MKYAYVVLGSGPQGAAAAYDLALLGQAKEVVLADLDGGRAREAAARVAKLAAKSRAKVRSAAVDATKPAELAKLLKDADGVLSTLPDQLNPALAKAALASRTHYIDLGDRIETTRLILKLDAPARKARLCILPDCSLEHGLATSLAASAMRGLDFSKEVRIYVGAMPEVASDPIDDRPARSTERLVALYTEPAVVLRRGKLEELPPMSEPEEVAFGPLGLLEARLAGGTSTCPWTFQGVLAEFECRILREPARFVHLLALREMGFLDGKPVDVDGKGVVPKELFSALYSAGRGSVQKADKVLLRVIIRGKKNGRPTEVAFDMEDRLDPSTGFAAAERATAFPAAAVLWLEVSGQVPPGAQPLETCLPHKAFLQEVRRRGLRIQESFRAVGHCTR